MFKKVLVVTSILAIAACNAQFPRAKNISTNHKGNKVTFDFQNQVLSSDAKKVLDAEVVRMKNNSDSKVEIEANCDKSVSGYKKYNIEIAAKRAAVVKSYLVKSGINSSRISVATSGAEKSGKNFKSKNTCAIAIAKK